MKSSAIFVALILTVMGIEIVAVAETADRFIELDSDTDTWVYDRETVQVVLPGRFTIVGTIIDHRDVMDLRLKTIDALETYCDRSAGKYEAPTDVLTSATPDMIVKPVKIMAGKKGTPSEGSKWLFWQYPFRRLALVNGEEKAELLYCMGEGKDKNRYYLEKRHEILGGYKFKELFDCKRGVVGEFLGERSEPVESFVSPKRGWELRTYFMLCRSITGDEPYLPD